MAEGNYNDWHSAHQHEDDISTAWHNFVKNSLSTSDLAGRQILEIGCGRGGFSEYLMSTYPTIDRLCACDYSESALEIGRSRILAGPISWQKEDIQQLSFESQSFDTVISCETIEHVPKPRRALEEMHRVLKPGGRLFLTCPNYFNLFGLWCLYRKLIRKPYTEGGQPYVNYIQLPSIYTKLLQLGFRIDHFHSAELVLPARRPKTFYPTQVPSFLHFFGNRTFYIASKK
jgi:2-polyprenyl-3-methyl-5-hydroxy-6-metoxy-1,4-benzoquinol methylase